PRGGAAGGCRRRGDRSALARPRESRLGDHRGVGAQDQRSADRRAGCSGHRVRRLARRRDPATTVRLAGPAGPAGHRCRSLAEHIEGPRKGRLRLDGGRRRRTPPHRRRNGEVMAHILTMPEVLTGATEARLSEWTVIEGDTVAEGDAVAEVETDKAVVALPTTAPGTVGKLLVAPGATVDVGTPLLVLLADGESLEEVELPEADSGAGATAEAPEPSPGGAGAEAVTERSPAGSPAAELPTSSNVDPSTAAPTNRLFASPLARRLVRERGLDLTSISGSGPQGRITRRDVDRHLDSDGPVLCSGGAPAE